MLIFVLRGFAEGEDAIGNGMVTSSDAGLTWSEVRDLSDQWGPASGSMPGPGTALQLEGPVVDAGRLLVVSHHGAYQRDFVTLSDDGGSSWRTINQTFESMDEAALTQLPNGSVLVNMRHAQSSTLGRAFATSMDDGISWSPIRYDATLVSPVCQASIVSFDGATYFSNPDSSSGRDHLTIRKSVDSAASWSAGSIVVQEGPSAGYSCLVRGQLATQHADGGPMGGILYEAVGGDIQFARFPLSMKAETWKGSPHPRATTLGHNE